MKWKVNSSIFLVMLFLLAFNFLRAQNILPGGNEEKIRTDTSLVERPHYYKTAEIAYEIENVKRFIKTGEKQITSFQDFSEIDSSFSRLSAHIDREFEEFNSFNKLNLSRFFLLNTKRVWLNYKSQLTGWQANITNRIQQLMQLSDKIKEKDQLWVSTANQPGSKRLPEEINNRILNSINELNDLETKLYQVVGGLSVLDSRISDKIIEVDDNIAIIDELHKNYRINMFAATQPAIWNISLKNSFNGSPASRLKKAWYENTKSLRDSIPSFKQNLNSFIFWSLLIISVMILLRILYFRQKPAKRNLDETDINELIIRHPVVSVLYMILFAFVLLFVNLPLLLAELITLVVLITTYFLLRPYIVVQGQRLIITFIVLLIANTVEIIFWYFGNYARLYLFFEAALGMAMVYRFMRPGFKQKIIPMFRYKRVVDVLRYPIFLLYTIGFIVNIFGFQNLTVLLLKIGSQVAVSIIIIIGAWEISRSSIYILFDVLKDISRQGTVDYLPLLKRRITWLANLFFALIWLHFILVIVELDTPFYELLSNFLNNDRHVGSFVFTYNAIFQFILIILITWGLTTIIKIIFAEGNFKKTQRLRGVPAAISITLRLIVALAGFLLALSGAGIDLTKISILIGAFGVGIGFGLQNIVNNFISGLILIYERPIQVGDTIEINSLLGVVKTIGIRSSNVRTFDGSEVVVPNSILVSDQLINWTLSDDKRRIEIMVGVKYGTDPAKVIQILKQVAGKHPHVAKNPEPVVLFNEFADSSLNFRLLFWVLFEHGIQTKSDISVAIDKAFKENDIEIPFPQLDLHVIDNPNEKEPAKDSEVNPNAGRDSGKIEGKADNLE